VRRCVSFVAVVGVIVAALAASSSAGRLATPAPPSGAELDALSQPPTRTAIASQRIYFVMTDRYRNGDPSNDKGGLSGGRGTTGFDPADIGYFHGGDFKGMTGDCTDSRHGLARLKDLGFTGIWVTPPVGQKAVQGDSAAYHGYWGLDFTNVDAHLGTGQDFADFVACAHRLGMKVYMDVVVNHTADVVQLQGGGSTFIAPSQKPYRTCQGKKFNPAKYVTKAFPCLKAPNMPYVPFLQPGDEHAKKPEWMNDVTKYHDRGDIDFNSCSPICYEQGDFFGLDDLFTEQPAVVQGLADTYGDWIKRYKIDGFRVDTAKHVNAAFFRLWVPKILAAARGAGVPDFEIFGEVTLNDDVELSSFVRDRGLPNVLDFPFQDAAAGYAGASSTAQALANRLTDDDYFRQSPGVAPTPVTFLGNHDMGRAALQIRHHGASEATLLQRVLLGYDVLYLLRGAPAVYYGDEVGMTGTGGDKQARQDMFPTQVDEWKTQERIGSPPIGSGSSFDVLDNPIEIELRRLGALKDAHPALSSGATVIRQAQGNVFVESRIDRTGRREYVVALNSGGSAVHVSIRTATPSSSWAPLEGSTATPSSGADGTLAFDVPPIGAVVLEAASQIPSSSPPKPALKVARDKFSALWAASATVSGNPPVSVAFAIKRKASASWQLLAADDSPPYRAFLDRARFAKKQKVYVVAIARSLTGETAVSKVVGFVPRPR
jgi:glycosidase